MDGDIREGIEKWVLTSAEPDRWLRRLLGKGIHKSYNKGGLGIPKLQTMVPRIQKRKWIKIGRGHSGGAGGAVEDTILQSKYWGSMFRSAGPSSPPAGPCTVAAASAGSGEPPLKK